MRIGLLTLPLHVNYGGILQAYALQSVLEKMGHSVVVYQKDFHPPYKSPLWKYPYAILKRTIMKCFVDKNTVVFLERKNKTETPVIRQHVNKFIRKNIHTILINKISDIDLCSIDCIIVGSDQIWRPYYVKLLLQTDIQDAFLKFTHDWKGKRITYAVSFGTDKWEFTEEETRACKKLIKRFDALSVREYDGVYFCTHYLGVEPKFVLDPTLLLSRDDYLKIIKHLNPSNNKNMLFCYILNQTDEKKDLLERISNEKQMVPYKIQIESTDRSLSLEERIVPPVEEWICCFRDSKFVVTDSFHGCVFSIIFRKPFVVILNKERGASRFYSLLKVLGLEDHLLSNIADYDKQNQYDMPKDLEYKLSELKKYSLSFLEKGLA